MDIFTIQYTYEAVSSIQDFAQCLELHGSFAEYLNSYDSIKLEDFIRDIEQKLAMKVALHTKLKYKNFNNIIDENHVLSAVLDVIKFVLGTCFSKVPQEGTILHMLDGYPINLLATICNTTHKNAHIMGESIKKFIKIRKHYRRWIPDELIMTTIDNNLEIEDHEMEALYLYLGTRSKMYVTMLTNCLLELKDHDKYLNFDNITGKQIKLLCKSSWLSLFLLSQ